MLWKQLLSYEISCFYGNKKIWRTIIYRLGLVGPRNPQKSSKIICQFRIKNKFFIGFEMNNQYLGCCIVLFYIYCWIMWYVCKKVHWCIKNMLTINFILLIEFLFLTAFNIYVSVCINKYLYRIVPVWRVQSTWHIIFTRLAIIVYNIFT